MARAAREKARPEQLGVFSPRRAGQLAGVGGDTIGQWARHGLIHPTIYEGRPANLYAFYDVAEAIVVHWLHVEGFSFDEIHHAISKGAEWDWPLLEQELGVARDAVESDRGVLATRLKDGSYLEVGRPGEQLVPKPELFHQAADVLRTGGWLAKRLGLTRIEVDPQRLGGAPTVKGHRWPVERVARIADDDEGRAMLVEEYELDELDIEESVEWTDAALAL